MWKGVFHRCRHPVGLIEMKDMCEARRDNILGSCQFDMIIPVSNDALCRACHQGETTDKNTALRLARAMIERMLSAKPGENKNGAS